MKKQLAILVASTACAGAIAQDSYWSLDLPGLYNLAHAQPGSSSVGLRAQLSLGLSAGNRGLASGPGLAGGLKAGRQGVFADWYPQGGAFRLVGGLNLNDNRADTGGFGSSNAGLPGKSFSLGGESFNGYSAMPDATPYLGIGYGQHNSNLRGLGFYADLGVTIGTFSNSGGLVPGRSGFSQADVAAQSLKLRDTLGGLWALPSASIGLLYRY